MHFVEWFVSFGDVLLDAVDSFSTIVSNFFVPLETLYPNIVFPEFFGDLTFMTIFLSTGLSVYFGYQLTTWVLNIIT